MWHRLGRARLRQRCVPGICLRDRAAGRAVARAPRQGRRARGQHLQRRAGRCPTFAVLVLLHAHPLRVPVICRTIIALVLFAVPPLLTNAYVGHARGGPRGGGGGTRAWGCPAASCSAGRTPARLPADHDGRAARPRCRWSPPRRIAALVGRGGLGRIITAGFTATTPPQVVAGALLVAAARAAGRGRARGGGPAACCDAGRRRPAATVRRSSGPSLRLSTARLTVCLDGEPDEQVLERVAGRGTAVRWP